MSTKRHFLDSLVSLYDTEGCPLGVDRLAEDIEAPPAEVREHLESFRSCELVKRSDEDSGYVPTITGRELLELDIDYEEFLIIEVPEEREDK